ncbi:MAG: SGNH/GDSL hydrolase family protein [Myxococcota bacterium]
MSALRHLGSRLRALAVASAGLLLVAVLPDVSTAEQPKRTDIVVHFGDSFVDAGLQQTLRPKFRAEGARYITAGKTSSWLATWAGGPDLDNLYWSYRPSLFLVTVGANDLFFSPADKRAHLVHEIVRKMRGTPCVWIGIPIWETAPTEFVEMMRRESAPCRYFDSNTITTKITRQADKRHPDRPGGALWADTFWDWLSEQRDTDKGGWALKPAPPEEHAPRPDPDPWGRAKSQEPKTASAP